MKAFLVNYDEFCIPSCKKDANVEIQEVSTLNGNTKRTSPFIIKRNHVTFSPEEKFFTTTTKFNESTNFKSNSKEILPNNRKENIKIPFKKKVRNLSLIDSSLHGSSSKNIVTPMFKGKNLSFNVNNNSNKSAEIDKNVNFISNNSNSYINLKQNINSSIIEKYPDLVIEEAEGIMLNGEKIIIEPSGFNGSPRKAKDGFVYFGERVHNANNEIINDIIIHCNSISQQSDKQEHYFIIYFNLNEGKYYIRPYSDNSTSFLIIKLNSNYKLGNKEYLVFSDFILLILIDKKDNNALKIKTISNKGKEEGKEYKFQPNGGKITIGRDKNCTIVFKKEKMFSKVHTTIYFNHEKNEWFMKDGGDLPSLNGTWLMPRHSFEITDGLEFKVAGNSKFIINYLYKK